MMASMKEARTVLRWSMSKDAANIGNILDWLHLGHDQQVAQVGTTAEGRRSSEREIPPAFAAGVYFSRRLALYYNIILAALLLVIATYRVAVAVRRRRIKPKTKDQTPAVIASEDGQDEGSNGASSSRALSPSSDQDGERKPLLSSNTSPSRVSPTISFSSRLNGILEYQPRNVLGTSMPRISIYLSILGITLVNIFLATYAIPWTAERQVVPIFLLMDRVGLVFVMNLPLLYLLAAKNCPLKVATGWSYEQLNILHRAIARICILTAILHFGGVLCVWALILRPAGVTLGRILQEFDFLAGLIAWISFMLLAFTSIRELRALFYELFLAIHIVGQVLAMSFLYFHHVSTQPYVAAALAIFIIDRVVYRCYLRRSHTHGYIHVLPDGETARVTVNIKSRSKEKGNIVTWKAGDHFFLTFPDISLFQTHPFTIASLPPPHSDTMDFIIRSQGGFSKKLLKASDDSAKYLLAIVDGPYGASHALQVVCVSHTALLIAGGSGIAVIYPLAHAARQAGVKNVVLLWIVHDKEHLQWLKPDALDNLEQDGVDVRVIVTRGHRPDLTREVPIAVEEGKDANGNGRTGIVVCGPDSMVRDVRNTAASLIFGGEDVRIVTEKFGW